MKTLLGLLLILCCGCETDNYWDTTPSVVHPLPRVVGPPCAKCGEEVHDGQKSHRRVSDEGSESYVHWWCRNGEEYALERQEKIDRLPAYRSDIRQLSERIESVEAAILVLEGAVLPIEPEGDWSIIEIDGPVEFVGEWYDRGDGVMVAPQVLEGANQ